MNDTSDRGPVPRAAPSWVTAAFLSAVLALFGFTAGAGLGRGSVTAGIATAIVCGALPWIARARGLLGLDSRGFSRALAIVSLAAAVGSFVLLARQTIFTLDSTQTTFSLFPSSGWELQHSCLSAYFVAGEAAPSHPDLYETSLYNSPADDGTGVRKARMMGEFKVDVYEYPPPFLLLPRALMRLAPDFLHLRMVWFALCGMTWMLALWLVARSQGPIAGARAILLAPLVLLSIPTLNTLQKGNVQIVILALSMLAMLCFERGRPAAGGALLAYATASKLYPGMLVVYLIARRQWKAVAWTAAMGIVLLSASLVDIGWAPYAHFLEHLPGLLGGEAFPAFRNPRAMAINLSIPGLIFKLGLLGVPGMSFPAAKLTGWVYTILVLAAIVLLARRPFEKDERPMVWLSILILATLRSPFLPQAYGPLPGLWMVTLVAAWGHPTARRLGLTLAAWLAFNIYWPQDFPGSHSLVALVNGIPQALLVALGVLPLVMTPRAGRSREPWTGRPEPATIVESS